MDVWYFVAFVGIRLIFGVEIKISDALTDSH